MFTKTVLTILFLSIFFCGAATAEWIYIEDVVGSGRIGDPLIIAGSTMDLPAGNVLHIRIIPVDELRRIDISAGPNKGMIWADTVIEPGPGSSEKIGIWSYTVNTSDLLPTAYFVRVYSDDVRYRYTESATAFIAYSPTQVLPVQTLDLGATVIFVNDEINNAAPDKKTAEAFYGSPASDLVLDCLVYKEMSAQEIPAQIPNETLSLILEDFPYSTTDGSVIVRDITVAELFDSMNTTITLYGWLTSVDTHEYVEIAVNDPVQKSDLANIWNFIQAIAKQNGFEKTIPVRFVYVHITDNTQDPTPRPTHSPASLFGILGGLGITAALIYRLRKH